MKPSTVQDKPDGDNQAGFSLQLGHGDILWVKLGVLVLINNAIMVSVAITMMATFWLPALIIPVSLTGIVVSCVGGMHIKTSVNTYNQALPSAKQEKWAVYLIVGMFAAIYSVSLIGYLLGQYWEPLRVSLVAMGTNGISLKIGPVKVSQVVNAIGNCIALASVAGKSFYDLYWNKRHFHKDVKAGMASLTAAEQKRKRADIVTSITFVGLAISYLILIIGGFYA